MKFCRLALLGTALLLTAPLGCGQPSTSSISLSALGQRDRDVTLETAKAGLKLARNRLMGRDGKGAAPLNEGPESRVVLKFHRGVDSVAVSAKGSNLAEAIEAAADALKPQVDKPNLGRLELAIIAFAKDIPFKDGVYAPEFKDIAEMGFLATDGTSVGFILPSEVMTQELWDQEARAFRWTAVENMLGTRAGLRRSGTYQSLDEQGSFRLLTFTGPSVLERAPGKEGRAVVRGIPQRDLRLTSAALTRSATAGGRYLVRIQEKSGRFPYLYHTYMDNWALNDNTLHQAAAGLSLLNAYDGTGDSSFKKAGLRSADYIKGLASAQPKGTKVTAQTRNFTFLKDGNLAKSGGTARAAMLLVQAYHVSQEKGYLLAAQKMGRHLLFMQKADGQIPSFYKFGPKASSAQERGQYLGSILQALLDLYQADGQEKWKKGARKLGDYMLKTHRSRPVGKVPVTPFYVRAMIQLSEETGNDKYATLAVRLAKGQLSLQHKKGGAPIDFVGGFERPPATLGTADRLIEMVYAYDYERRSGRSAPGLRRGAMGAAHFLRHRQFDHENAYFTIRPKVVEGGVRNGFISNKIRIDYVHRSMVGFYALAELLKEDEKPE